jgi:hypothetical protein
MSQAAALDVSDIVSAVINIAPTAIPYSNFGTMLILGSSNVIDLNERVRQYANIIQVGNDFGNTSPEYYGALRYFSQTPQPNLLFIGRWAQSATNAILHGAILTPTQQLLANFTAINAGAFYIKIDGVPANITGLNFSGATTLPGVAAIIQTAIRAIGTGGYTNATVVWNSGNKRFDIISGTTGALSSLSYGKAPTALGSITLSGQPSAADTITLNGTVVTFVTSLTTGNQVLIGASAAATLTNLRTFLAASADTQLVLFSYNSDGVSKIYLEAVAPGVGGNSLTLAKSGTNIVISGATLTGGTATDSTGTLGLTAASGAATPVGGSAIESALTAVQACANVSSQWYALHLVPLTPAVDADHIAIGSYILASSRSRIYGVTIQNTACLDPTQTSDLASALQSFNNKRVFWQYSSQDAYAAISLFGRAATVNFDASLSAITLMFKQEPGEIAESLTESQYAALKAKGGNVFVNINNGAKIIMPGQMSNGFFIDEVHNLDWFQNAVQTDVFNLLYQSTTKVPQTDDGAHLVVNVINDTCQRAINNGVAAPGKWNASGFGQLVQGQVLTAGFYVYCPPMATQSQADRETRVLPPIQIALKLAGAVHNVPIIINVNR